MRFKIFLFLNILFSIQVQEIKKPENEKLKIGDYVFGGIIFWIDKSGQHGLVCAKEDQAKGTFWYDTLQIKNRESKQFKNIAIEACEEYSVSIKGVIYNDWYLPSKEELFHMYENRDIIDKVAIKNSGTPFSINTDLSPTEFCNSPSWDQVFNYGYQNYDYKNSKFNVRAIRAF